VSNKPIGNGGHDRGTTNEQYQSFTSRCGNFQHFEAEGYFQPCPHPKPKRGTEGPLLWLSLPARQGNHFGYLPV